MIISAFIVSLVQIPIIALIINSYHLSPEMVRLTWQYAIGVMVAAPFGLISTVGVLQLQIIGKTKILLGLSVTESVVNLFLDFLFVGLFHMGIAGAGYGTMAANILRCLLTVLYIAFRTDIYKSKGAVFGWNHIRRILSKGLPDAANSLMLAIQNIFLMKIILSSLGETGGAIKGVCALALSSALVLVNSILGSTRPLAGIMTGGRDWAGMRLLMRRCVFVNILLVGGFTAVCEFFPNLFYIINGMKDIPENGLFILQLFAVHFLFKGITELTLLSFNLAHYRKRLKADSRELEDDIGLFYLTLKPDEAIEASKEIHAYADEIGFEKKYSYRIALCIEEMVAYVKSSQKNGNINIQIIIRFQENGAIFMMLDDGKCIALDDVKETQKLITGNYDLIKKLANTVEYQYLQNMNYSVLTFDCPMRHKQEERT